MVFLGKHPAVTPKHLESVYGIISGAAPISAQDAEAIVAKNVSMSYFWINKQFNTYVAGDLTNILITHTKTRTQRVFVDHTYVCSARRSNPQHDARIVYGLVTSTPRLSVQSSNIPPINMDKSGLKDWFLHYMKVNIALKYDLQVMSQAGIRWHA